MLPTSSNAVNPKSRQLDTFFSAEGLVADLERITSADWMHHYLTQHHYIVLTSRVGLPSRDSWSDILPRMHRKTR